VETSWDNIVIGAGHNGLSAACTLAAAKQSVLVVEQLPVIGGLSTSLPWVEQAPQHLLSVGAMDDMFMAATDLAEQLKLADYGYVRIPLHHPYGWMNEDGDTLLLFSDFDRTLRDIRYFSPRDAKTYAELRHGFEWIMRLQDKFAALHPSAMGKMDLAKIALSLATDKPVRRLLGQMISMNIFDLIAETFESEAMRGLWGYWTSMIGPADLDGSGLFLMAFAGVHRKRGVLRPLGGMSGLMNAFAGHLKHHGGEIRCGQPVARIVVTGGRAVGVELADGCVLQARKAVLSSCAPQLTLGKLLDQGVLDRNMRNRVALIPANSINAAAFKIDIAVGGQLHYGKAVAKRKRMDDADIRKTTFMTGTLEEHIEQLTAMKLGRNVPTPPVYMSILSANDASLAPAGHDVLYLHANVPAAPVGVWAEHKQAQTTTILASASRFLDGFSAEIGRVVHSPADFESRYGTPKGCYFHVDMTPLRMGMNRPAPGLGGYATPVAGLYMAGAGVHPGGGVSGWPGRLAAQHALQRERR
jgi:phytoene dehydrogenase-like protein